MIMLKVNRPRRTASSRQHKSKRKYHKTTHQKSQVKTKGIRNNNNNNESIHSSISTTSLQFSDSSVNSYEQSTYTPLTNSVFNLVAPTKKNSTEQNQTSTTTTTNPANYTQKFTTSTLSNFTDSPKTIKTISTPTHSFYHSYRQSSLGSPNLHGQPLLSSVQTMNNNSNTAAIAMTLDIGSRYENSTTRGITHYVQNLLFHTAETQDIKRQLQSRLNQHHQNVTFLIVPGREQIQFIAQIDSNIDNTSSSNTNVVDNNNSLIEDILSALYSILGQKITMNDEQLAEFDSHYRQSLTRPYDGSDHADQLVHNAAFNHIGIGSSPISFLSTSTQQQDQHSDPLFHIDLVNQWHRATFTRNRISATGVNISHPAFMKSNEQLIQKMPNSNLQHIPLPQTAYNPRKPVHHIEENNTLNKSGNGHYFEQRQHIRVGFLAPSITHQDNLSAILLSSVLQDSHQQFQSSRYWQYSDVGLLSLGQSYLNPSIEQRDDIIEDMFLTMKTRLRYDIHNDNIVKNAKQRVASHYHHFATAHPALIASQLSSHLSYQQRSQRYSNHKQQLDKTDPFANILPRLDAINNYDLEQTLDRILKSPPTVISYTSDNTSRPTATSEGKTVLF